MQIHHSPLRVLRAARVARSVALVVALGACTMLGLLVLAAQASRPH